MLLQSVYQGIDWRDTAQWKCNGGVNPLQSGSVENVPMSPYELVFVKVKTVLVESNNQLTLAALAYEEWLKR